ncbi:hypothetical protein, partial [Enterobacter hormaechei]|uniref:hypothetical protein n=1 Tax=Enterobacter hormaechei TaxID=158836 RepID=UPI001F33470E
MFETLTDLGILPLSWISFVEGITVTLITVAGDQKSGNDSNLLIVFYVQIMPDDFVMQLHR